MRRIAQAPSHYEVELRQPASGEAGRRGVAGGQARRAGRDHVSRSAFATLAAGADLTPSA